MPGSSGIDFLMFVLLIPSNVIMLRCRFAACEFVRGGLFPPPAAGAAEAGGGPTGTAAGRGLVDVEVEVDGRADPPGAYHRKHLLALIGAVRGEVIQRGLFTELELAALTSPLERHLDAPAPW